MTDSIAFARSPATRVLRPRRGVAVVLVLGVLGVTLAVFYAMMRTQSTSVSIQENVNRKHDARQAAQAGIAAGLRRLHDDDWVDAGGVNLTLNGDLGNGTSYHVAYVVGDASLTPTSPDYAEYPYRVTITSTGYASDSDNPAVRAEHQMEAVVQLVRRAMQQTPSDWYYVQNRRVYEWDNDPPANHPGSPRHYQLYPGGKEYEIPNIRTQYGSDLSNIVLEGNVLHNPLGVFYVDGPIELLNRTTIRGVVITRNSGAHLEIRGTDVVLHGVNLPRMYGQNAGQHWQLPVAIVGQEVRVRSEARADIAGLVMAWDEFRAPTLEKNSIYHVTGRIASADIVIDDADGLLSAVLDLLGSDEEWAITPDPNVQFHWHDWTQPLFVPHPDDEGLLWDLVRWSEQP